MSSNKNVTDNNRLQELGGSDYKIAEGEDNIKGWDVKDAQDHNLGDVDELIFDMESLKVRYLVLDLDKNKELGIKNREVLIPIGMAELDRKADDVILRNITLDQIRALPDYDKDHLDRNYESRNYASLVGAGAVAGTGSDFYNNENFNDTNLYRNRRRERVTDETDMHNPLYSDRSNDLTNKNRNTDENNINRNTGDNTSIPVIEEELNVGKKEVERGGIHITSRVVENPVEKNINLREEHVSVERKPVNRRATESDFDHAHDQDIEIHEHKEVPVVNKEARVVEEVRLKKEVTEHEEKIKENVRKTEVKVDELNKNKRG
jgi:stress response protein YsnF